MISSLIYFMYGSPFSSWCFWHHHHGDTAEENPAGEEHQDETGSDLSEWKEKALPWTRQMRLAPEEFRKAIAEFEKLNDNGRQLELWIEHGLPVYNNFNELMDIWEAEYDQHHF